MWDPGADYGAQGLIQSMETSNALRDGGAFSYRSVGPRKMSFPLLLRDVPGQTLLQTESLLREWTTAGAYVAIQPETVASGEAVFFDVLDGRWEPDYDGYLNRAGRRRGTLYLDTQPFGYWPTMILLASAASIGGPGVMTLNTGGSYIGDAPGLGELFIAPTSATSYGISQKTETIAWSLGARPSFQAFWPAASLIAFTDTMPATLFGDKYAPASQTLRFIATDTTLYLLQTGLAAAAIPAALESAYRGRFRFFAWARFGPSQGIPYTVSGDVGGPSYQFTPLGMAYLASAAPVATVPVSVASWGQLGGQGASPAFSLIDLGEIGLPLVASQPNDLQLRIWGVPAQPIPGGGIAGATTLIASSTVDIGGFYLQPLDGAAGLLPRGLYQPTYNSTTGVGFQGRFYQSAVTRDAYVTMPTSTLASLSPVRNALTFFRGALPIVGATTLQLDLLLAGKRIQNGTPSNQPPLRSEPAFAQVSVRYRPTFQFLHGL